MSKEFKVAIITGIFVLISAFITGLFTLLSTLIDRVPTQIPSVEVTTVQIPVDNESVNFSASSALVINGNLYSIPTDNNAKCLGGDKATRQTGVDASHTYNLIVPNGWCIVWNSYKAYWTPGDGQYENDGLLEIHGHWEGTVQIITGEYCAVPVEWAEFARTNRREASPHQRVECVIRDGKTTCK